MLTELFRKPLTVGHGLVTLGVAAAVAAGATAIAAIPGPDGTIKACIKKRAPNKGALRAIDHNKRCSRRERTLTWSQKGTPGAQGQQGPQGSAGSPDSGSDILGKLAPVDGSGSGLDADALDGRPSADFLPARTPNFGAAPPALPLSWTYYDYDSTGTAGTEFDIGSGLIHIERTGVAGDFMLCAQNNVADGYNLPYVVRVGDDTTANAGSLVSAVGTTEECDGPFTVPTGREFTIHVQGALIVGTPRGNITSNAAVANRWRLIGFAF
jgi:hypothetical protein